MSSENLPCGCFVRALEHQMFEEMRDAGFARRIVGRAVAIPDHMGDDRRAMIRDHHDVHAVVELRLGDGGTLRRGRGCLSAAVAATDDLAPDMDFFASEMGRAPQAAAPAG